MSTPVLFLDFDGVFLIHGAPRAELIAQLQRVLNTSGTDIVVSSSWRRSMSLQTLTGILRGWGLSGVRVVGKTPIMTPDIHRGPGSRIYDLPYQRGHEIAAWLKRNPRDRYAIVDDNSDFDAVGLCHLVQTDPLKGITIRDANQLIVMLQEPACQRV